ncbi:MAG: peptide ABC transporter substrate-binding protein [Clostridiales bacterium]|nr:peptide ABC transporter substrate-binding protein [Clostridiales bacterium]
MKAKNLLALVLAFAMLATACGGGGSTQTPTDSQTASAEATASAGEAISETPAQSDSASGVWHPAPGEMGEPYTYTQSEDLSMLNYLVTNKAVDAEDGYCQFLDNLLQTDRYGILQPAIAESWEVNDDATVWTFHLRNDVKWVTWDQEDTGKVVTAHDFVTGLKYVLDPYHASVNTWMVTPYIKGAAEYEAALIPRIGDVDYKEKRETYADFSTVGIRAVDDFTLEYTMTNPTVFFDSVCTYGVYLPLNEDFYNEIGEDSFGLPTKESILYCGAFTLTDWTVDVEKTLTKNPNYYQADRIHIPYLRFFYAGDEITPAELYLRGEVSAAPVTTTYLDQYVNDPVLSEQLYMTKTSSASWYWFFNMNSNNPQVEAAAKNENFRKAIWAAFNKTPYLQLTNPAEEAVDAMNSGSYMPPGLCVTAEGKDYTDFGNLTQLREANRNSYDPAKAKELLATAKTELGDAVSWPLTIRIMGTTSEISKARNAVVKQGLETALGTDSIVIETALYTSDVYYDFVEGGEYDLGMQGWSADYADPNNYLGTWLKDNDVARGWEEYGDVYTEFEKLYNEADTTYSIEERYEKFAAAEGLMYERGVFFPFNYTGGNYAISKLQNPYDQTEGMYGTGPDKYTDQYYGTEPISAEQREAGIAERDAAIAAN